MINCPLCNGKGKIPNLRTKEKLKMQIKSLRNQGLTVRQIAKIVNRGSSTVFYHIKKLKNEYLDLNEDIAPEIFKGTNEALDKLTIKK